MEKTSEKPIESILQQPQYMLISLTGHPEKSDACSILLRNWKIVTMSSYWEAVYHIHLCIPSTKLSTENRVRNPQIKGVY